jgi:hypothetical protein
MGNEQYPVPTSNQHKRDSNPNNPCSGYADHNYHAGHNLGMMENEKLLPGSESEHNLLTSKCLPVNAHSHFQKHNG